MTTPLRRMLWVVTTESGKRFTATSKQEGEDALAERGERGVVKPLALASRLP